MKLKEQYRKQFLFEFETWKIILENIQNENLFFKNRLAQIIKDESSDELLNDVEEYHNLLLSEDTHISLLRNDVFTQESRLSAEQDVEEQVIEEMSKEQKKLRKEIEIFELNFNKTKYSFISFFSEKMLMQL